MYWNNFEKTVRDLEANYPNEDILELEAIDLEDLIKTLPGFEESEIIYDEEMLHDIMEVWLELREQDSL
jgi:FeS assembly protein IscX